VGSAPTPQQNTRLHGGGFADISNSEMLHENVDKTHMTTLLTQATRKNKSATKKLTLWTQFQYNSGKLYQIQHKSNINRNHSMPGYHL